MSKFGCSLCTYVTTQKKNVERHINRKNKCSDGVAEIIMIPVEIACKYCNKSFASLCNLNRHMHICKVKKEQEIEKEANSIKQIEIKQIEKILTINTIENFMYILQEREIFS